MRIKEVITRIEPAAKMIKKSLLNGQSCFGARAQSLRRFFGSDRRNEPLLRSGPFFVVEENHV
jgi:hypothetical protein